MLTLGSLICTCLGDLMGMDGNGHMLIPQAWHGPSVSGGGLLLV
jgi:hypothetical protein